MIKYPSTDKIKEILLLFDNNQTLKAINKIKILITKYPKSLFLWNALGTANAQLKNLKEAEKCFKTIINIDPKFVEAHYNLGRTQKELGNFIDAEKSYEIAIKIKPDLTVAYNNLGNIKKKLRKYSHAILNYKKAIELNPNYAEAYFNLGNTNKEIGKHLEAISNYNYAIKLKPDYAEAFNELGGAQNEIGKDSDAALNYIKAINLKPSFMQSYNNYTNLVKIKSNDPVLLKLKKIILKNSMDEKDKIYSSFAMGKAQIDLGNFENGFNYLKIGNTLRKKQLNYNIQESILKFSEIKNCFKNFKLNNNQFINNYKNKPIFILGMPRSGTTLVEQILSSHSLVHGAGELEFLNDAIYSSNWKNKKIKNIDIEKIRNEYLAKLNTISDTPYIVDKMPLNFQWIGFIAFAFPEAKIIHLKRKPMAVCWSNYKINFAAEGMAFSFDLEDVAKYYKLYENLMKFWHKKLPNRIYDLDYDNLTGSPKEEKERLLEHLELKWENAVLNFYKNKRAVRTASNSQIRKNIYKGSSEEWKKYDKWLHPIKKHIDKNS